MMLLKRLLLPGKGDAIICILILLNVLLWCGELGQDEPMGAQPNSISSAISSYSTIFAVTSSVLSSSKSPLSSTSSCKYCGATLVTYYYLISLQLNRVYASDEILVSPSQGPTQQPVFNKTDPLSMKLALKKGEGGATIIASQHNNYNYDKRRRPVHNNSRHRSVISSNSSNFLSDNNDSILVNKISLSGTGDGSDLLFIGVGSGNSSSTSALEDLRLSSDMTDNSEFKMNRKTNITMHLKRRKRGRTRNALHNHHVNKNKNHEDSTIKTKKRNPRLLKELTMFNRQNCLSKLLCGVQVAQPPTKSSSAVNDYAYLVKAFFDRFSIRGIVTDVIDTAFAYEKDGQEVLDDGEADDEDDDDDDSSTERKMKHSLVKIGNKYIGGAARHKAKRPHNYYHKYNPKYYEEYDKDLDDVALEELLDTDMPDFMEPEILRRRMGKKFVKPFNETECGNCTAGVKTNKSRVFPKDINLIRKKRGMGEVKRGFMGFFNPRFDKTAYLDKRQLELETTDDAARQLNIAEEIAYRLRSPRQCRLLNWFGNNGNIESKNAATSSNGMTTTITTITNTGGMVGNLERLNGMQTGLPQSMNTGTGGPGSQVVTVIQQSPVGASNGGSSSNIATTTVKPSSKATVMLNNMGQSASNAMAQAKDVATHLGSTICPFNIHELQELILKAQGAPFPHFLTTPPPSPTFSPSQLFSHLQNQPPLPRSTLSSTTTTTTTTTTDPTTTVKATKPPPPASTTSKSKSPGQTRHGLEPEFRYGYDEFSDPEPTPPRYYHHPTAHYLYDSEVTPPTPPRHNYYSTTPRHRVIIRRPNQTPRPPPPYYHHHTTPVYPTPAYHDDYYNRPDRQTNKPVLIPPVGLAEVEENFEEHDSYSSYHSGKGASPFDRHKVHYNENRQQKPIPKWMTTTTLSPDDLNHYGYDEPVPNYSYGTTQKSSGYKIQNQQNYKNPYSRPQKKGYKLGSQPNFDNPFTRDHEQQSGSKPGNQPNYKNPFNREQSNGQKRRPSPQNSRNRQPSYHNEELVEHVTFKIGPDLPRETTVAPTTNYIREFHNPPVVVDSKKRFPPVAYRQRPAQATQSQQPNAPKPPNQNSGQNRPRPQQNNKSEEDDDDDSDSNSSDESDESSSGEARANVMANNPREPPGRRDPPTLPPPPPPPPGSSASVEDEDDESNEAVEKKEVGAEDDDDESDEDNESNDENDGKRSYERNDFSKDRVGSPAESNTEKPMRNQVQSSSGDSTGSNGFFSGILNSFGSITSMFNRNNKEKNPSSYNVGSKNTHLKQAPPLRNHLPPPPPSRQVVYPKKVPIKSIDMTSGQESDEEGDDDDDNESEDDDEDQSENRKKSKPKVKVTTTTAKPKKSVAPKKKNPDQPAELMPWVSSNTKMQVFLKTTPVPVVIEASSIWSVKRGHHDESDDDYDEEYNYNPIESLNDLMKKNKESEGDKQTKKKENLYSGLGLSPGLSEFLNDLHQDLSPTKKPKITSNTSKKVVKTPASESVEDDDNDDDDASDESDEDDVSGPPKRRKMPPRRPPFLPQEPID